MTRFDNDIWKYITDDGTYVDAEGRPLLIRGRQLVVDHERIAAGWSFNAETDAKTMRTCGGFVKFIDWSKYEKEDE